MTPDATELGDETTLHITKPGYYADAHSIPVIRNQSTVVDSQLHPIADGAFASTLIVLDSQGGAPETQLLLETLARTLTLAGARVHNIAPDSLGASVAERIERVNAIEGSGYYLQINHESWQEGQPIVRAAHYPGNRGTETLLKRVLEQVNRTLYETPIVTVQDGRTPEIQQTNKGAMVLDIRSLGHPNMSLQREAVAVFLGMWAFLKDETEIPAEKQQRFMRYLEQERPE